MNTDTHAAQRVQERLIMDAGMDEATAHKFLTVANMLAEGTDRDSEAVRLFSFDKQQCEGQYDRSNGNNVWGIYRNQNLVTIMFRRDNQPSTCDALRVRKVTLINA